MNPFIYEPLELKILRLRAPNVAYQIPGRLQKKSPRRLVRKQAVVSEVRTETRKSRKDCKVSTFVFFKRDNVVFPYKRACMLFSTRGEKAITQVNNTFSS